jgi:hypothetical protein
MYMKVSDERQHGTQSVLITDRSVQAFQRAMWVWLDVALLACSIGMAQFFPLVGWSKVLSTQRSITRFHHTDAGLTPKRLYHARESLLSRES